MAHFTVDRFEGDEWAVLEDDQARTSRVPRHLLPPNTREGDVLDGTEHADEAGARVMRFELNAAAREERLTEARRLRDSLPRGPKGDVSM
ncbi:MAG: DUF3006 domain-containing protein [Vicinamibacterales bacterium]